MGSLHDRFLKRFNPWTMISAVVPTLMKVQVNFPKAKTAVRDVCNCWLPRTEYLINVSNVFMFVRCCTSFDRPHVPPQHSSTSGEEHGNVASILLQLARSDLESSFDCLLSYQNSHVLDICPLSVSRNMQILCLGATQRGECKDRSIPPVFFFFHPRPPYALIPPAWFFHPPKSTCAMPGRRL